MQRHARERARTFAARDLGVDGRRIGERLIGGKSS